MLEKKDKKALVQTNEDSQKSLANGKNQDISVSLGLVSNQRLSLISSVCGFKSFTSTSFLEINESICCLVTPAIFIIDIKRSLSFDVIVLKNSTTALKL